MGSVDDALQEIDAALEAGDFEAALELANRAVETFPAAADLRAACGEALWNLGVLEAAGAAFETAVGLAPASAPLWAALARLRFAALAFAAARAAAQRSLELEENPEALDVLCRLAERDGDLAAADGLARRAHALDAEGYPLPYRVEAAEFERLVTRAVEEIPERFQAALAGEVAILIRAVPPLELLQGDPTTLDPEILGLYAGTALTERSSDFASLPDRIYLFQRNLEHVAATRRELVAQIRITVFHEVGHYFGFSDEELEARDFG